MKRKPEVSDVIGLWGTCCACSELVTQDDLSVVGHQDHGWHVLCNFCLVTNAKATCEEGTHGTE